MASARSIIQQFEKRIGNANVAALKDEYRSVIRPAYVRRYGSANLAAELDIDESDSSFNGLGCPGYVQVTMGVAKSPIPWLRTFAVAHETGHSVAFVEFMRVGIPAFQPINRDAGRHEQIADLIAMRVLMERVPAVAAKIAANAVLLAQALGPASAMHPSGQDRAQLVRQLYMGRPFGQLIAALANRSI
jgi:hypothetical protein